jgi:hypothetical protein
MQLSILAGIYADGNPELRNSYPRNYVPVIKKTGLSDGYLKPASGLVPFGAGGVGIGRGGINWNDKLYRVLGPSLCCIAADGAIQVLGNVGPGAQASLDMGFDRLAIASAGDLFYWDGFTLTQVTDPNLGTVNDVKWIAGYYVTTDGEKIVVTNLNDPTVVNPLKYGSIDADPGPVMAIDELRSEIYGFGRYVIQVFQNVGGDFFPFEAVPGALVPKGIIGTHAYCSIGDTFVFLGSGRGEAPAIHMLVPGDTEKISTREIDTILAGYTEAQLAQAVMEVITEKNQQLILLHLPDRCLAYDTMGSKALQQSIWYTLDSGMLAPSTYRARNFVWCYDGFTCEDPTIAQLGQVSDAVSTHYGDSIGWEFGTPMIYNEGNDAIVLELELVALPGRVPLGADPVVWTSHSFDGERWGVERAVKAGKQGERTKRIAWRNCGRIRHYRMQKFRGTSDAHLPVVRLEAKPEPLATRPGNG